MAISTRIGEARLTKAISMTDLLDAAGISAARAERMDDSQWALLATAARVTLPSKETCRLVISMLRARVRTRRQLSKLRITTILHDRKTQGAAQ